MDDRATQAALCAAGYSVRVDGDFGPKSWAALFACIGRTQPSALIADLGAAADVWLAKAGITTRLRVAHALAQWAVETYGFTSLEENLNYSADRLMKVWPARFPTAAIASVYAHNPQALANKTYGGRFGNTAPGDGWRHRGRGGTMLTFKDNYAEASDLVGLDLLANPDQVAQADVGLRVACAYWTSRNINAAADADDILRVRPLVNGGLIGIDDARRYLARAKLIIK